MVRPGFGFGQGSVRCSAGSAKNSSGSVQFGQNWVRSYPSIYKNYLFTSILTNTHLFLTYSAINTVVVLKTFG